MMLSSTFAAAAFFLASLVPSSVPASSPQLTVNSGSAIPLSPAAIVSPRRLNNCSALRFLALQSTCGVVEPPRVACNATTPSIYTHRGCASREFDRLAFVVESDAGKAIAIERVLVRVEKTNRRLVALEPPSPKPSIPFNIRINVAKNETCFFDFDDEGGGTVRRLLRYRRYACDLSTSVGLVYDHGGPAIVPLRIWLASRLLYDFLRVVTPPSRGESTLELNSTASLTLNVNQRSTTPILLTELSTSVDDDAIVFRFAPVDDSTKRGAIFTADWPFAASLEVTQGEIRRGQVAYRPPPLSVISPDVFETFEFRFSARRSRDETIDGRLVVNLSPIVSATSRVARNDELIVVRNGLAIIRSDVLRIDGNSEDARLHVTNPPLAGKLLINVGGLWRRDVIMIKVSDLADGRVRYEHDGGQGDSDRVIFELVDNDVKFPIFFVITVIDDNHLRSKVADDFKVRQDEAVMISNDVLNAWNGRASKDELWYQSKAKRLYLRGNASSVYRATEADPHLFTGLKAAGHFTQRDIDNGRLWYLPPAIVGKEAIHFDITAPSNRSLVVSSYLTVTILPPASKGLRPNPGASLFMTVEEKSTTSVDAESLQYISDHADISYVVTKAPRTGQLTKNRNETAYVFTQTDVDEGKIAYRASNEDIGWNPQKITFEFKATDADAILFRQIYSIWVEPVDDNPPKLIQDGVLSVREGGTAVISASVLRAEDDDTRQSDLRFTLTRVPEHGVVTWAERKNLSLTDEFLAEDLLLNRLVYHHGGADVATDSFGVRVSDGVHSVLTNVTLHVDLIHNDKPMSVDGVKYNVSIAASDLSVIITPDDMLVYDPDTPDDELVYKLLSVPNYGRILVKQLNGALVTTATFTQSDIVDRRVSYEVLYSDRILGNVTDRLVFRVGPLEFTFRVSIRVPPGRGLSALTPAPFEVFEAGSKEIQLRHLNVQGTKASPTEVLFKIAIPPLYGNVSMTTFTLADVQNGRVWYNQSLHRGIEPVKDTFAFDVTDGISTVRNRAFAIAITPTNDEIPVIVKGSPGPVVRRGTNVTITPSLLRITDSDVGSNDEDLIVTLTETPTNGRLILRGRLKLLDVADTITVKELHDSILIYYHDGSRTDEDRFAFSVSDGRHHANGNLTIQIFHSNQYSPTIVNNTGVSVNLAGEAVTLQSLNLAALDEDSLADELVYTVTRGPRLGRLFLKDTSSGVDIVTDITVLSSFRQSDVDAGRLHYEPPVNETGRFAVVFSLSDGRHVVEGRFDIRVNVVDVAPPVAIANSALRVQMGKAQTLTSSLLEFGDDVAKADAIAYTFDGLPSSLGYFARVARVNESITRFTQADVNAGSIAFVHSLLESRSLSDALNFTVSDGTNSIVFAFRIEVVLNAAFLPRLVNEGASVFSDREKIIRSSDLALTNTKTPPEKVVFVLTIPPQHGHLTLKRMGSKKLILTASSRFTQSDIQAERLGYVFRSSKERTEKDSFQYRIIDPSHSYYTSSADAASPRQLTDYLVFDIRIVTADSKPPRVIVNTGAPYLGPLIKNNSTGYVLSLNHLTSVDDVTESDELEYVVVSSPTFGRLIASDQEQLSSFTQRDIAERRVSYVLERRDIAATNDSFVFDVTDRAGNVLEAQVFRLQWAYIAMESSRLEVLESGGLANVTISRHGDTSRRVSFTCQTAFGSANGEDFRSGLFFLSFEEGETQTRCRIPLFDDANREGEETFDVTLGNPVQVLLFSPSTTVVTIIDPEDDPVFGFEVDKARITETTKELRLVVHRRGDLSRHLAVICYTESGTATGSKDGRPSTGDDFISRPNSRQSRIGFRSNVATKTCVIEIVDDTTAERAETFSVHLAMTRGNDFRIDPQGARVDVTIIGPNDESTVQLSSSNYHVNESDGFVSIEVTRSGPDVSSPLNVSLATFESDPVSARAGKDYNHVLTTIAFKANSRSQSAQIEIFDDDEYPLLEGPETFKIRLYHPLSSLLGTPRTAVVTIDDQSDIPVLDFATSRVSINEGNLLILQITRSGSRNVVSTARCYTESGSAVASSDFAAIEKSHSSPVEFLPGIATQECYVIIQDDDVLEGDETFTVHLDDASNAVLGRSRATITIRDPEDIPRVGFESRSYAVSEPRVADQTVEVSVTLIRTGDMSRVSRVRCNTQDASASAGDDYAALSELIEFKAGDREATVVVRILFDAEKEFGETFFLWLSTDDGFDEPALGEIERTSITIADSTPVGVRFLAAPRLVSLIDYGTGMSSIRLGYPVICVTSCDETYGDPNALLHCKTNQINHRRTLYRWEISDDADGTIDDLRAITFSTVFTVANGSTLESVYIRPRSRLRCYATPVDVNGVRGVEMASDVATTDAVGVCSSSRLNEKLVKPSIRFKSDDVIHVRVRLPHIDGYVPVVSTKLIVALVPALLVFDQNGNLYPCSNIVAGRDKTTRHTFLDPYSCSAASDGNAAVAADEEDNRARRSMDLYRHLDIEDCVWTFDSCYSASELQNSCGGTSTTHRAMTVPLFVYYVRFSASTAWLYVSYETELALSFSSYSQPTPAVEGGYAMRAHVSWTKIYIRKSDGRLVLILHSSAEFRGRFVLAHPDSDVRSHVDSLQSSVRFDLDLLENGDDSTNAHKPKQEWRIVSALSLPDYVGEYTIVLVPCTVPKNVQWSMRVCNPEEPMRFSLPVNIAQTLNPNPVSYELRTRFELLHTLETFLRDPSETGNTAFLPESSYPFGEDSIIYGRVMVEPTQNLGDGFLLRVERVYLCTGRDGHIPAYDPDKNQYGCLRSSPDLERQFKILDRSNPSSADDDFLGIPFDAQFASANPLYDKLTSQKDDDGFTMTALALHRAGAGYAWYLQVVFSIEADDDRSRRRRRSSASLTASSLRSIRLESAVTFTENELDLQADDDDDTSSLPTLTLILAVAIPAFVVVLVGVILIGVSLRKRRTSSTSLSSSSSSPPVTDSNHVRLSSLYERNPSTISVDHQDNPYLASFLKFPDETPKLALASRVSPVRENEEDRRSPSAADGNITSSIRSDYSCDDDYTDDDDEVESLPPKETMPSSHSFGSLPAEDSITTTL